MRIFRTFMVGVLALTASGCKSIGPGTLPRDRFNYSSALAESWKNQMLLNLVKTRYLDLPIYLEVGQIVSGYTLERSGSLGVGTSETDGASGSVGGSVRFSDSPTITYSPLTGEKFLETFLAPIEPGRVFALLQAGYSADFILELCLDSLNGLRNRPVNLGSKRQADPGFFLALKLLREIQDEAALGLRVDRPTNGQPATVLFFRNENATPESLAKILELRKLLDVSPGRIEFRLVSSPFRGLEGELGVTTRSMIQLIGGLALGVEVPANHLERKLTPPTPGRTDDHERLIQVHSGPKRPKDSFIAVPYLEQWFWIANDDWRSKRTFTSLLFLFTLSNSGTPQNMPTLTIPTR